MKHGAHDRRGVLLLEIIVALTIMATAMAFVGSQLVGGLRFVGYADQQVRAGELAERIMALIELDPEATQRLIENLTDEGDFGEQHPGWFWRATVEPLTDVVGLHRVTIQILYNDDPIENDDIAEAEVVYQLHLLKAEPGQINPAEDFGLNEEQMAQFESFTGAVGLPPVSETGGLDPQVLIQALTEDPATMAAMLPMLMQMFQQFGAPPGVTPGEGGAPDFAEMSPEQLTDFLMNMAEGGVPGAGDGTGVGGGTPGGRFGEGPGFRDGFQADDAGGATGASDLRTRLEEEYGGNIPPEVELLIQLHEQATGGSGGPQPRMGPRSGGSRRGAEGGRDRGGANIRDLNDMRDALNRRRGGRG